jgi:hypothetical protein
MAYVRIVVRHAPRGAGECGPACSCGPHPAAVALGEWYVRDDARPAARPRVRPPVPPAPAAPAPAEPGQAGIGACGGSCGRGPCRDGALSGGPALAEPISEERAMHLYVRDAPVLGRSHADSPRYQLGQTLAEGPVFRFECPAGCPPHAASQCRIVLRQAILDAISLASNAARKLEANPPSPATIGHFRGIFGHPPSRPVPWAGNRASGAIVADRFRRAADGFRTRVTHYSCGCPGSAPTVNARAARPNLIRLCPRFWTQSRFLRAGTLIHEMMHLLFFSFFRHFRTPPRPDDPQERRRDNARCYKAFALLAANKMPSATDIARCRARPA